MLRGFVAAGDSFDVIAAKLGKTPETIRAKVKRVGLEVDKHPLRQCSSTSTAILPALLLSEFAEKIAGSYYKGCLNAAIQDLINKALAEQDFVYSHITHIRTAKATANP